jgi:hypothetical protein
MHSRFNTLLFAVTLLGSSFATAKPLPKQAPMLPKQFCQDFEAMEAEILGTCSKAAQDRPAVKSRLKVAQRVVQQCRELLEFSTSEKRVKLDQYHARLCLVNRRSLLTSANPGPQVRLAVLSACRNVLAGQRGDKQECETTSECKRGLSCLRQGASLTGKCGAPLTKDATCNEGDANDSAFYNFLRSERSVCSPGLQCLDGVGGFKCRARVIDRAPAGKALCS